MLHYYAALDIGSNSVKSLLTNQQPAKANRMLAEDVIVTQLAAGMSDGRLADDAMVRTLDAVAVLVSHLRSAGLPLVLGAAATSAVRDASNGPLFMHLCKEAARLMREPEVLSGTREAALSFRGASSIFPPDTSIVNVDPGGRSTEVTAGRPGMEPSIAESIPIGCVRLRDACTPDGVCPPDALRSARRNATAAFGAIAKRLPLNTPLSITGGTAHLAVSLLQGHIWDDVTPVPPLSSSQINTLLNNIANMTSDDRAELPGMPPGRAAIAPAGLCLLLACLNAFNREAFIPNPRGLRAGICTALADGIFPPALRLE